LVNLRAAKALANFSMRNLFTRLTVSIHFSGKIGGNLATTKSRIYVDFKGEEANIGSVWFSTLLFNMIWLEDETYEISTVEYRPCVKCIGKTFETAWRHP